MQQSVRKFSTALGDEDVLPFVQFDVMLHKLCLPQSAPQFVPLPALLIMKGRRQNIEFLFQIFMIRRVFGCGTKGDTCSSWCPFWDWFSLRVRYGLVSSSVRGSGWQIPITDMVNFLAAVRVVSLFKSCLMRKILIFLSFHVGGGNCVSI